jgi:hypothetical protein
MVAAPSLALTDYISTAADTATRFFGSNYLIRSWQSFRKRMKRAIPLLTADWKRAAKLRAVLLLAESRDSLLLATCKCRPLFSCILQPARRSVHPED